MRLMMIVAWMLCLVALNCKQGNKVPGQFAVKGQLYILDQSKAGVVSDNGTPHTDYGGDAGLRVFDYNQRQLFTPGFAGRWDEFDSLEPRKQLEIRNIAMGALAFLRDQKKMRILSETEQEHEKILTAFLSR